VANIYYGDGVTSITDGNWNHAANWYLTLGSVICCICTPGTPAGRVPQQGDSVVLVASPNASGSNIKNIVTGPVLWNGPVSWLGLSITIQAGNFSGPVIVGLAASNASGGISGGTFSGPVAFNGTFPTNALSASNWIISGGTFTGTVTRKTDLGSTRYGTAITGGTYSPRAAVQLLPGSSPYAGPPIPNATPAVAYQLQASQLPNLPVDPGFAVGGGTFAPVLVIAGIPGGGAAHHDEPRRRAARDEGTKHKQELLRSLYEHGHINSKQYQRRK
jgi:hypothetical protein